jgi:hypothetical protein
MPYYGMNDEPGLLVKKNQFYEYNYTPMRLWVDLKSRI